MALSAGIRTFPFQIAVNTIFLVIWGEHGFTELTGIVSLEDFVEPRGHVKSMT